MKKIFFAAALAGAAMLASCGGNKGGVQMGSLSDFDSLSYAIGANVGYGLNYQMKDIPFDYEAMAPWASRRRIMTRRSGCCATIS